MTIKFKPPFTQETLNTFVGALSNAINHFECISVMNLAKRDQLYRVKQLKNSRTVFEQFVKDFNRITFIYLDLTSLMIEDAIDLDSYIENNIARIKKRVVIFVLDADRLLDERPYLTNSLDQLTHQIPGTSLIYLFQKNITSPVNAKKLSRYTSFLQNTYIFPFYSRKDGNVFISQLEQRFGIKIEKRTVDDILTKCGGNFWLIKQVVRELASTKSTATMFNNDGLTFKLETITQEFSQEEIDVLNKIIRKNQTFSKLEEGTIHYFLNTNLIKKTVAGFTMTVPLLVDYLKSKNSHAYKLSVTNKGHILINNIDVPGTFSRNEQRILNLFIHRNGEICNRDEIAKSIWGEDYLETYTDWALDQIIRRIRNKLIKIGMSEKLIKTKKNQGYLFDQPI